MVVAGKDYKYIEISGVEDSRDPKLIRPEVIDILRPHLNEIGARAIGIIGDFHITLAESKMLKLSYIIKIMKNPENGFLKMMTIKSN